MPKQLSFNFDKNIIEDNNNLKDNCLLIWCNDNNKQYLLEEWDYEKNDISIEKVSKGTTKKYWWKCPKGHSYEASVSSRTLQGSGCPYCTNEKPLVGFNDLSTKNPDLALEYDFDKNTIDIKTLMPNSNKKVWWLCKRYKHSWEATVSDRTSGKGCPYCSIPPKKILKGFNDLFTTNPELKESWDFTLNEKDPYTISKGSNYKAHWICEKGHKWEAVVSSRTANHNGCPICSQGLQTSIPEKVIAFYLSKVFDDITLNKKFVFMRGYELDIFIPSLSLAIEYDGGRWHQDTEKDLEKDILCVTNNIQLIRVREYGCPKYLTGVTLIPTKKPNRSMKYMDEVLEQIFSYIESSYHIETNADINVTRDYNMIINMINYNDIDDSIAKIYPESLEEWNYAKNGKLSPYSFKPNSNIKVWWKCVKCNYEWEAVIESRFGKGRHNGCPRCAGKKDITGFSDISTLYPEVVKYWDYSKNDKKPEEVAAQSNKKYWWVCDRGHSYEMVVNSKTKRHHGCPICNNQKIQIGYNDLSTTHPELCKEWDYEKNGELLPTMVKKGTDKKVWWKCSKCGFEWDTYIYNRTGKSKSGCPNCYEMRRKKNSLKS